jgi:hypothetical protein
MSKSIRPKRRNRWRLKAYMNKLDAIALKKINASYVSASSTWGGSRCSGCGINVRPHWVVPWVWDGRCPAGSWRSFGQTFACDRVKCPGERDWQ